MAPMRMPDLASLEMLIQVVDLGSIGKAAAHIGTTQASASRRLDTLEEALSIALLVRSTTGSRPTVHGQVVVDWAREVVDSARKLMAGVKVLRDQRGSVLSVAASMTIAEYLMPAWLVAFRSQYPAVNVTLHIANSTKVADLVREGSVNVGFVETLHMSPDLRSQRVGYDRLVAVVSPDHSWARRRLPLTVSELCSTPLVVREAGSGTRSALEEAPEVGQMALPLLELTSNTAVKIAVKSGAAPAVLSALAVSSEVRDGSLVEVEVEDLGLTRPLRAVWQGPSWPPEPVSLLLQVIAKVVRTSSRDCPLNDTHILLLTEETSPDEHGATPVE